MLLSRITFSAFALLLFTSVITGCDKEDIGSNNNNNGPESLLCAHSWTSKRILRGGADVTGSTPSMTIRFYRDGSFEASGFAQSSGRWIMSRSTLTIGNQTWALLELTTNSLKIQYATGLLEVHFSE